MPTFYRIWYTVGVKITNILPLEGWHASAVNLTKQTAFVKIEMNRSTRFDCPHCSRVMQRRGCRINSCRDLSLGTLDTMLEVSQPIGYCRHCNTYITFRPKELHPTKSLSWRLMHQISKLLKDASASLLSNYFNLSESSILRADKEILSVLNRAYPVDLSNRRYLIIDEKYLGRKRKFMTCVIDNKGEVIYTALGKSQDVLAAFFERMTKEQRECIRAVSIDRSNAFHAALKAYVPHARICFDPFHIISNVNQAVDEVRRTAWREANKKDKSFIKGTRFLLLGARERVIAGEKQKRSLEDALTCNKSINKAYWLKEQLRFIYKHRDLACVSTLLNQWLTMAEESQLKPFERLAKTMRKASNEILNFFRVGLSSGRIEGLNSTISLISRKMRGISSLDYLFLKLRQRTCPEFTRHI